MEFYNELVIGDLEQEHPLVPKLVQACSIWSLGRNAKQYDYATCDGMKARPTTQGITVFHTGSLLMGMPKRLEGIRFETAKVKLHIPGATLPEGIYFHGDNRRCECNDDEAVGSVLVERGHRPNTSPPTPYCRTDVEATARTLDMAYCLILGILEGRNVVMKRYALVPGVPED